MAARREIALTRKELYRRVWSKPLSSVAKEVGVSGNALAKICSRLLVPYPSRGHWAKVNGGKHSARPPLPAAPERQTRQVTISSVRAASRRARTRLQPSARREQLIEIAADIVRSEGLHAASMKRIAATAGISETQAYNYFGSRERLFAELARREFATIRAIHRAAADQGHDHYSSITLSTRSYLREIARRGGLLQVLLSNPAVRFMLREEHRKQKHSRLRAHARGLMELYGIPWPIALACTVVLTRLCLRAGHIIADRRISLEAGERLCLAMVLQGSRNIVRAHRGGAVGRAQRLKAA
jgi:AcrR family transcriptional regulator